MIRFIPYCSKDAFRYIRKPPRAYRQQNSKAYDLVLGTYRKKLSRHVPFSSVFPSKIVPGDIYIKNTFPMSRFFEKAGHTATEISVYVPRRLI